MDSRITDGTGKGNVTKVDGSNRLWTYSTGVSLGHFESLLNGNGFNTNIIKYTDSPAWVTLTATGGPLLIVNNRSTKFLVLTRIMGTITGAAYFWLHAYSSAQVPTGNSRLLTARNLNFGQTNNTLIECYGWNGTGDGMTGLTLDDDSAVANMYVPAAASLDIPIPDTWLLPPNASFVIEGKGVGGTPTATLTLGGFLRSEAT
jgi:hypothetical protein